MEPGMSTVEFKILIGGLLKRCQARGTRDHFWKVVRWGLKVLLDGHWPYEDHNGDLYVRGTDGFAKKGFPLAGGLFCVIFIIKCDQDYVANGLGLQHASARQMCPWCQANCAEDEEDEYYSTWGLPVAPWNDITDGAEWLRRT